MIRGHRWMIYTEPAMPRGLGGHWFPPCATVAYAVDQGFQFPPQTWANARHPEEAARRIREELAAEAARMRYR